MDKSLSSGIRSIVFKSSLQLIKVCGLEQNTDDNEGGAYLSCVGCLSCAKHCS